MRVLLDESVPRQLADALRGHEVRTVAQMGWVGLKNSELLRRAAMDFGALITLDRNLEYQQPVRQLRLGVIVLLARDSRVPTVLSLAQAILDELSSIQPGELRRVSAPAPT